MNDTSKRSPQAALTRSPDDESPAPGDEPEDAPPKPAAWQAATFTTLDDATRRLDELAAASREHQLVVLGPALFVVEWR